MRGQYRGKSGKRNKDMKLSKTQKEIVYGLVLGDAYVQATGASNARLRLEHSAKQEEYMRWLYQELRNLFAKPPDFLQRIHPQTKRMNSYLRLQSQSSPWFGALRKKFYDQNGKRRVPEDFEKFLSGRTLAIWYMDDGCYYKRDKSAHIYLPKYTAEEIGRLKQAFERRFSITAKVYCRPDRKSCQITINGDDIKKFRLLIEPYIIPSMRYKIPLTP